MHHPNPSNTSWMLECQLSFQRHTYVQKDILNMQQFVRLFQDLVIIIEKRFASLFDIIRKLYK